MIAIGLAAGLGFSCNNTLLEDIQLVQQLAYSVVSQQVLNVIATPGATGQIILQWDPISAASGYHVYYNTSPGTSLSGLRISGIIGTTTTLNLSSGITYYFSVTAYDSYGESKPSTEVSATAP